jgi:hypothetical protein
MKISDDIDCSVYVNTSMTLGDLARAIANVSAESRMESSSDDGRAIVRGECFEIEVLKNRDADSTRRIEFPDGFLYFSSKVDVYVDPSCVTTQERIRLIDRLLEFLWGNGIAAVAACDYESQLHHGGGFNCAHVPWPQ